MADFRFALLLLSILLRLALAFPNLRIPSKLLRRDERCGPGGADWGYCGSTYIDISPYYNGGGGSVDYSGIGLDYSAGLADQIAQSGRAISDLSKRSLAYGNAGGIAAKAPNEKRQMWHEVAFCCHPKTVCKTANFNGQTFNVCLLESTGEFYTSDGTISNLQQTPLTLTSAAPGTRFGSVPVGLGMCAAAVGAAAGGWVFA